MFLLKDSTAKKINFASLIYLARWHRGAARDALEKILKKVLMVLVVVVVEDNNQNCFFAHHHNSEQRRYCYCHNFVRYLKLVLTYERQTSLKHDIPSMGANLGCSKWCVEFFINDNDDNSKCHQASWFPFLPVLLLLL